MFLPHFLDQLLSSWPVHTDVTTVKGQTLKLLPICRTFSHLLKCVALSLFSINKQDQKTSLRVKLMNFTLNAVWLKKLILYAPTKQNSDPADNYNCPLIIRASR